MVWLVIGGWAFAVLFAVVLLGFAGYELAWKARRLQSDKAKLDRTAVELSALAEQLRAAADRASALTAAPAEPGGRTEPTAEPGRQAPA